jgi:beta-lactamase regulating signal transducer with metallopeptidase domain
LAYWLIDNDGWAVMAAVAGLVLYLLVTPAAWNLFDARPAGWIILAVGIGNLAIVAWKHRAELARPFIFRRRKANASQQ